MAFAETVRKTWENDILFSVLVELTYRCNLDCAFCYNDLALQGVPMSREDYFRFFEDLAEMQVLNLSLSGGEPLAHPDFFALGVRARELGFLLRVKSNGHALRGRLARRLKREVDPFIVELSLHGACAETHDRQTRVPGSFDRLLGNLREMLDLGLRVKLNSTLTRWNEREVAEMYALADSFGVLLQYDPDVSPRDDGDTSPLALSASPEGLRNLFALQRDRAAAACAAAREGGAPGGVGGPEDAGATGRRHCGAGSGLIAVDPFGNVYPCVAWRRAVGNLHETSVKQLWSRSPRLEEIRRQNSEAKQVVDAYGADASGLNFCPGSAFARTGDPRRVYPAAQQRADILARLREETARRPGPAAEPAEGTAPGASAASGPHA